ncbi:MAG: hypothetical protein IJ348_03070 [Alistipes sp.]|nr:hypothetical protein [Alistipes sp.]
MAEHKCADCPMRAKYEAKPKSFVGRVWRWHINFCPGWKAYFLSLSEQEREALRQRYTFTKY